VITRVSRYQKGKTNLDFTEARDSEWQWHQLRHNYANLHLAPDRQITMPAAHHSVFYRPGALPAAQPTVSKHRRQIIVIEKCPEKSFRLSVNYCRTNTRKNFLAKVL